MARATGAVKRKPAKRDDRQLSLVTVSSPKKSAAPTGAKRSRKPAKTTRSAGKKRRRATAESLATKQRDISVAEFFTKNRHLLGFDNPTKALLTTTKEAVDNALDACEDAGILPDVHVSITPLNGGERFRVTVKDNGPGIVKAQIPKIFGKLLYGSKFHTLRQARGQQGIGISAAGMYGQLTTGVPIRIVSRTKRSMPANLYTLRINTQKNRPEILEESQVDVEDWDHGTEVGIELEAVYRKGPHSVDSYVEQTAVANPHATIRYESPDGEVMIYDRTSTELPPEPREMKPHPYGVELGLLLRIFQASRGLTLKGALQNNFSRVSPRVAAEICKQASLRGSHRATRLSGDDVEAVYRAIQKVKIMAPPSSSVVPIGEDLIIAGLKRRYDAAFYFSCTRSPSVYRGNPFVIEAGIAFGGDLPADGPAQVMRFANRVPLQYQKGGCGITAAVMETSWKNYGIQQPRGSLPVGPMAIFVHMASAWVPFTSESKEAIAHYPEIISEIKHALQSCGRQMGRHIRAVKREGEEARKRQYIEKYLPHIGIALRDMLGLTEKQKDALNGKLERLFEKKER
jgi:DNA topoisomerase-6 subunit B